MTLSTHVLDIAAGAPAVNLEIALYRCSGDAREELARARTSADGRLPAPFGGELAGGEYELVFYTGAYFSRSKTAAFYDRVPVRFRIANNGHYHVPLLLSPWGYSTYRGS